MGVATTYSVPAIAWVGLAGGLVTGAFGYGNDFYAREFWWFVMVQEKVADLAATAIDYPPMQDPASFNLDAVKKKIDEAIRNHRGK